MDREAEYFSAESGPRRPRRLADSEIVEGRDVEAVYITEGERALPSRFAGGIWDPRLQHGGALAALLVQARSGP